MQAGVRALQPRSPKTDIINNLATTNYRLASEITSRLGGSDRIIKHLKYSGRLQLGGIIYWADWRSLEIDGLGKT